MPTREEIDEELRRIDAEKLFMNTKESWTEKDFARDKQLFDRMVQLRQMLEGYNENQRSD